MQQCAAVFFYGVFCETKEKHIKYLMEIDDFVKRIHSKWVCDYYLATKGFSIHSKNEWNELKLENIEQEFLKFDTKKNNKYQKYT